MPDQCRVGDLEINQDLPLQRLSWKLQRIGWCVMAVIVLLAWAGLLGPGPLSSTTAGVKGSLLWMEFNRFERYQSPVMLKVHIGPGMARGGKLRLWLNREYTENIELQHIDPEPESVQVGDESITYVFNVANPQKPATIIYHLEPNARGRLPLQLGLHGGPHLNAHQFIYP